MMKNNNTIPQRADNIANPPGAGRTSRSPLLDAKNHRTGGKFLSKKKPTKPSKAKVKRIAARRFGREAVLTQLTIEELCWNLAGKFARKSAQQTGDQIGDVRDRYEAIALGFVSVRQQVDGERHSLINFLLRERQTTDAIKGLFERLGQWLGEDLLTPLAEEYVRDRGGLMQFLLACFKRWQDIYTPHSRWRTGLVTQQLAARYGHNRKRIAEELLKRGVISSRPTTERQWNSLLSWIGQQLCRDQRKAVEDGFGPHERLKLTSFGHLLRRPSEFAVRRNV